MFVAVSKGSELAGRRRLRGVATGTLTGPQGYDIMVDEASNAAQVFTHKS